MKENCKGNNHLMVICIILISGALLSAGNHKIIAETLVLKGPYLGQKLPGKKPQIFAPGFISTDEKEFSCTFSADGREFYFSRVAKNDQYTIFFTQETESGWTQPQIADFAGKYFNHEPYISNDGRTLFFGSIRPLPDGKNDYSIWTAKRVSGKWADLKPLGFPAMYVTEAENKTIYFTGRGRGGASLARARFTDGKYQETEILGEPIISDYWDGHPCIAPDESWLIFDSENRPDAKECGLFISFKNADGSWAEPKHLIKKIPFGRFAMLSPDGKYLFFSSKGDIYWISSSVINDLR